MKIYKFFIMIVLTISVVSFFISGVKRESVEKLAINSALGHDLEGNTHGIKIRSLTTSEYVVTGSDVNFTNITTKGKTLPEAREEMQKSNDKKILYGLEKVYIIGEEYAGYGIMDILDSFYRDTEVRDSTLLCVCQGKAEDILKVKVKAHSSVGDFIEGLIRYSREMNFFPDNYKIIDCYVRIDSEGRNLVLPYISVKDGNIQLTGLALFKGSKMVGVIPNSKVKQHNLLRESNLIGVVSIQENSDKYISVYGKSKRKVKCYKENNKYRFVINLKIVGDIATNEYEPFLVDKPEIRKEVEAKLQHSLEKELTAFLAEYKSEYKVDTLELGRVAAAKYGRDTGVDWNEIVSNSQIDVNVSLKIGKFGRGDI